MDPRVPGEIATKAEYLVMMSSIGVMGATQLGVAVPNFWFAMLLVLVFSIQLRWFGAGGFPGWEAGVGPAMKALTLPAVALALPQASILARVMRSALIEYGFQNEKPIFHPERLQPAREPRRSPRSNSGGGHCALHRIFEAGMKVAFLWGVGGASPTERRISDLIKAKGGST